MTPQAPDTLTTQRLRDVLEEWVEHEWLRPLDRALAMMLMREAPDTPPVVFLIAALTSHQAGRGHVCLDLCALLAKPVATLALPPGGADRTLSTPAQWLAPLNLAQIQALLNAAVAVCISDNSPLVLDQQRVYLRRYFDYETRTTRALARLASIKVPMPEAAALGADLTQIGAHLAAPDQGPHWQKVAMALAQTTRLLLISGGPGCGKTTTVLYLLALMFRRYGPQRIVLAAPTGKAAARLSVAINAARPDLPDTLTEHLPSEVRTLHRVLGARPDAGGYQHRQGNPLFLDWLVIDEASMIDLALFDATLAALPAHAGLILLGDKDQLASVEAGAILGELCQHAASSGYRETLRQWLTQTLGDALPQASDDAEQNPLANHLVLLRHSHRFRADGGIGQLAAAVNAGDAAAARASLDAGQDVTMLQCGCVELGPPDALLQHFLDDRQAWGAVLDCLQRSDIDERDQWAHDVLTAFSHFALLSPVRAGSWGTQMLNHRLGLLHRKLLRLPAQQIYYIGRPIILTQNDRALGLMNGDVGMILADSAGTPYAVFQVGGGLRWVLPARLGPHDSAYALTVHKSQGSEFSRVACMLPAQMNPILTRELLYTAITRAKNHFSLICAQPTLLAAMISRRVERASGLAQRLKDTLKNVSTD